MVKTLQINVLKLVYVKFRINIQNKAFSQFGQCHQFKLLQCICMHCVVVCRTALNRQHVPLVLINFPQPGLLGTQLSGVNVTGVQRAQSLSTLLVSNQVRVVATSGHVFRVKPDVVETCDVQW